MRPSPKSSKRSNPASNPNCRDVYGFGVKPAVVYPRRDSRSGSVARVVMWRRMRARASPTAVGSIGSIGKRPVKTAGIDSGVDGPGATALVKAAPSAAIASSVGVVGSS